MDPIVTTAKMGVTPLHEGLLHGNIAANPVPTEYNGRLASFVVPGSQAYLTAFGLKADEVGALHGKGYFAIVDGSGNLVFEDKDCLYEVVLGPAKGPYPATIASLSATGIENRTGYGYALRTESDDPGSPQGDLIVTLGRADAVGANLMPLLLWAQHG